MSEIVDKKRKSRKTEETVPVQVETAGIEGMDAFSPQEVVRLLKVKGEVASGRYSDITNEHRKLLFVQWLIDNGKLQS